VNVHEFNFELENEEDDQSRIHLIAFDDITLGTERRYLVKGLIPRTGLIVVWGPPKSGKSFIVFDLVMHIALDWRYRGRRVHPGFVVYCAFEGQFGFDARCAAFRQKFLTSNKGSVPFYLQPVTLDLVKDAPELLRVITRTLGDMKPVVIVLDTLNRSLRGSESRDEDMTAYIGAADTLREAFDCAVIIVHHCGIDASRPRGHTSLTGAADAQLSVTRDTLDDIVMTIEYMKDGATGDTIISRLESVEVGIDDDGEPISSCVVVPSETFGKTAHPVSGNAKGALEALYEAIAEEGEVVQNSRVPRNTRTTMVVRWQQYFEAKTISDTTKPDSKRRAFVRASKTLQGLKIIDVWNDRVWVTGQVGQART